MATNTRGAVTLHVPTEHDTHEVTLCGSHMRAALATRPLSPGEWVTSSEAACEACPRASRPEPTPTTKGGR